MLSKKYCSSTIYGLRLVDSVDAEPGIQRVNYELYAEFPLCAGERP